VVVDGRTGNNLPARYGSSITVVMQSSSQFDTVIYGNFSISGPSGGVSQSWFIETRVS
jgi:hypothetical protein